MDCDFWSGFNHPFQLINEYKNKIYRKGEEELWMQKEQRKKSMIF